MAKNVLWGLIPNMKLMREEAEHVPMCKTTSFNRFHVSSPVLIVVFYGFDVILTFKQTKAATWPPNFVYRIVYH